MSNRIALNVQKNESGEHLKRTDDEYASDLQMLQEKICERDSFKKKIESNFDVIKELAQKLEKALYDAHEELKDYRVLNTEIVDMVTLLREQQAAEESVDFEFNHKQGGLSNQIAPQPSDGLNTEKWKQKKGKTPPTSTVENKKKLAKNEYESTSTQDSTAPITKGKVRKGQIVQSGVPQSSNGESMRESSDTGIPVVSNTVPIDDGLRTSQPSTSTTTEKTSSLEKKPRNISRQEKQRLQQMAKQAEKNAKREAAKKEKEEKEAEEAEEKKSFGSVVRIYIRNQMQRGIEYFEDFDETKAKKFLEDRIHGHKLRNDAKLAVYAEVLLENMCPVVAAIYRDVSIMCNTKFLKSLELEKNAITNIFAIFSLVASNSLVSVDRERAVQNAVEMVQTYVNLMDGIRYHKKNVPAGFYSKLFDYMQIRFHLPPKPKMDLEKAADVFSRMRRFFETNGPQDGFPHLLAEKLLEMSAHPVLCFDAIALQQSLSGDLTEEDAFRAYALLLAKISNYTNV